MCTLQVQDNEDNYQGWFWVGGFHQWLVEAGVGREAAWGGRCCCLPSCSCPEPAFQASLHILPAVVDHRHHADLRQRGEPEEAGLAGARIHPPRLVLLCRLPGGQQHLISIHSSSSHQPEYFSAKPFSAAGPHLCTRAWEQQRLQRRVVVRDHQPTGRPSSKSTNTYEHKHIRVRTRSNTNT